MAGKVKKAVAEVCGIYHVGPEHNALIHKGDWFKGRLIAGDLVLCLGQGQYLLLQVNGRKIKGIPEAEFSASPLGIPHDWKPTLQELYRLHGGLTLTAPVDLTPQVDSTPSQVSMLPMLAQGVGER